MKTFLSLVLLLSIFHSSRCEFSVNSEPDFIKEFIRPRWEFVPKWPWIKDFFPYHVQSPIDIITSESKRVPLPPLGIHFPWNSNKEMVSIENTGYYLEVLLPHEVEERPYLTGGPLNNGKFIFEQLHFHWGPTDDCGSENRLDGQCFSTEVHLVFYNDIYGDYTESINHPDGVAVLALFGQVSKEDNPSFEHLTHELSNIADPESKTNGSFDKEFKFLEILFKQKTYHSFPGSLTTPSYSECVTWIVCTHPYDISAEQLHTFRTLKGKDGKKLNDNDRSLQDYAGRPMVTPMDKNVANIFRFSQEVVFVANTDV